MLVARPPSKGEMCFLPSGGPPSSYARASWGQHGETTTLPWETRVVVDEPDHVALALRVRLLRFPLLIQKTLHLYGDRPVLTIEERLYLSLSIAQHSGLSAGYWYTGENTRPSPGKRWAGRIMGSGCGAPHNCRALPRSSMD